MHSFKSGYFPLLLMALSFSACLNDKGNDTEAEPEDFTLTFGGAGNESGNSVAISTAGDVFCFGTNSSGIHGGRDFMLVKTDVNGNKIFEKNYGGSGDETGYCIIPVSGSGMIMAGSTKSFGAGGSDVFIIKIDNDGNEIFSKTFGSVSDDVATTIINVENQGYLIGGFTTSGTTDKDFYLVRITENGDTLWTHTYGGPLDDNIHDIKIEHGINNQLQFLVLGNTNSYGAGDYDFYLMKLNGNGETLWANTYGGSGYEQAGSILIMPDRYYLCGHTASNGHPEHNVYLLRTDTGGVIAWEKNYGGMMHDGTEMGILSDGNQIVMTGYSSSYGAGDVDFLLIKTDLEGDGADIQVIGNTADNAAFGLAQTSSSYYLAGYQKDSGNISSDMLLVRVKK